MRLRIIHFTVMLIVIAGSFRTGFAQTLKTASPPILIVELNSEEPPPPDALTALQLDYAVGGLGSGDEAPTIPYWFIVPHKRDQGGTLLACGYRSSQPPVSMLTYPSGHHESMEGREISDQERYGLVNYSNMQMSAVGHCWIYVLSWFYGIERGVYTFSLSHSEGDLTYTWQVDYSLCPGHVTLDLSGKPTSVTYPLFEFLMGFSPDETLVVRFFRRISTSPMGPFPYRLIATRKVKADADGALVLDVKVGRSAPFVAEDIIYAVFNNQNEISLYFSQSGIVLDSSFDPIERGKCTVYRPKSSNTTLALTPTKETSQQYLCSGTPSRRLVVGQQGRVLPDKANRIRNEPGGDIVGKIPVGESFIVLAGPECTSDGTVWWKVNYNGTLGWTAEGKDGKYWVEQTS